MMEFTETCSNIAQLVLMEQAMLLWWKQISFKAPYPRNHDRFYQTFYWIDISGKTEAESLQQHAEWES
jgi:hypothetical protein